MVDNNVAYQKNFYQQISLTSKIFFVTHQIQQNSDNIFEVMHVQHQQLIDF